MVASRSRLTTWAELPRFDSNVLIVVNSPAPAPSVIAAVQSRVTGDGLHIAAPPATVSWLEAAGITANRIRRTVDANGQPLEINHFLETSEAFIWSESLRFQAILGTAPHNLYNEEVQLVFERRVSLLLGDGVFLAQCLPHPYVYVFDGAALVRRFNRPARIAAYREHTSQLIADLYGLWLTKGRPRVDDSEDYSETQSIIERHLGGAVIDFDENSRIEVQRAGDADGGAFDVIRHLRDVILDRERRLIERNEAVNARDRILEAIAREPLPDRLRRLVGRSH